MQSQNDRKQVLKTLEEIEQITEQTEDNIYLMSENIKNRIDTLRKENEEILVI